MAINIKALVKRQQNKPLEYFTFNLIEYKSSGLYIHFFWKQPSDCHPQNLNCHCYLNLMSS